MTDKVEVDLGTLLESEGKSFPFGRMTMREFLQVMELKESLAEVIYYCRQRYDIIKKIGRAAKSMVLNNFV